MTGSGGGFRRRRGQRMDFLRIPLVILVACHGTHAAPPEPTITVFGVRLGQPLKSQCPACPEDPASSGRLPDRPCWTPDPVIKEVNIVRVSLQAFEDLGRLEVRRVREVGGVVVEVQVEFPPSDVKRVERHLRKQLGPPTSSEAYERDSRLFGLRKAMAHTWRGGGATLHFLENSASGNGSVRGFLDSWAEQAAREEKFWRDWEEKRRFPTASQGPGTE